MKLLRIHVTALATLLGIAWALPAAAAPGSGSALLSPSGNVAAGTVGTWTLTYTAAENFKNGTLRLSIPSGWTAPQNGSPSGAGYVTVATSQPAWSPVPSFAGQTITVPVDTLASGNTVTVTYGAGSGKATAATTPGAYTFLVESSPGAAAALPIASSPSGQVVPGAPFKVDFSPADTTATAGDFAQYRLLVFDQYDNRSPVASNTVISVSAGGGSFFLPANHATPVSQVTVLSGQSSVRFDYRGQVAGGYVHFAIAPNPLQSTTAGVTVVAGPLSTANATISATSPVTANGTAQSSVVVTSRDAFDNPRENDTVAIAATGSAVATNPSQQTQADGTATGVVTDVVAQPVTVSATINGQPVAATANIVFVAGAVSAATSTVNATTPVVADGVATSTITVTARDANNNPIDGLNVVLVVTPPGNAVLTQPGGATNSAGQVTGELRSTVPGPRTVTATIGATPVTDNALVQFNAGVVASIQWSVDGNGVAGVFESVTLRARDTLGNTVTGYTGTANLSTTSGGVGNGVVEWAAPDAQGIINNGSNDTATYAFAPGDSGVATLRMTDTRAETLQLIADIGGPDFLSGSIVVVPNVPDQVLLDPVTGNGQTAEVNTAVAIAPGVRVTDQFGNNVSGATVNFSVTGGGGSVGVASGITDSGGLADCMIWTLGTIAGPNTMRASIASGSDPIEDFTATGNAGANSSIVLTPPSQSVTVGASQVVTATLRDQYTNPIAGQPVTIAITDSPDGSLSEDPVHPTTTTAINAFTRAGNTDANGQVTVQYDAPAGAGLSDAVDASATGVSQASVTDVVFTTIASGATNLRITFQGASMAAAFQPFEFLVEALDGNQNVDSTATSIVSLVPEAGSTLEFSLTSGFAGTVTQMTLSNGQATVYGRGTKARDWDITVNGSLLGSDTDVVTITDTGVIDHYDVSNPASVTAGTTFNVSVTARDVYNNPVVGANNVANLQAIDDVTTNPAQSTLQVGQTTLSGGVATQSETYTKAEPIRVRASSGGPQGISGVLSVSAAGAYRIAEVSGDSTGVAVGAAQPLVSRVFDAYDNPVANETVTFVVLDGGGNVSQSTDATDATGTAQTTLTTGTIPGNNAVKATILGGTGVERVDYLVETVPGLISYFTVVLAKLDPIAGEPVSLTVTAFDAQDNPVSGDNSTQIQLLSGGAAAQFAAATGTLSDGTFTTTVTDTVAEAYTVTVEVLGGGPPSGTSGAITVSHAEAFDVVKVSGDASGVTAGATQLLQVRVRDQYGNPIPTWPVAFAVDSSPGGAFITDATADPNDGISNTDATGLAAATVHTSVVQGANVVNAQILDGAPARERVTFTVNTQASGAITLRITFIGPTTVNAGATSSFKVDALDAGQNIDTGNNSLITLTPEASSNVEFSVTGFPATITTFNLVNGTRTILVRATRTGDWDITADDGPSGLAADSDEIHVNDSGVVDHYAVTAPDNAVAGTPWNVSIEARDVYNNKVVGAGGVVNLVALTAADSTVLTGVALSSPSATVAAGAVVTGEAYTKAETIRVRVRDGGAKEGFSGSIVIAPAAANRVINTAGDGTVTAGQTRSLTAQVLDQYNNAVPGQTVAFSIVSGGGSIGAPASGPSDANGNIARVLATGTIVGANVARATILDGAPAGNETTDFTVNTTAGPIQNYRVEPVNPTKINLTANETTNVIARARDQYNNVVTQDNTTTVTLSATGSAVLGAASGTLSNGTFTTTVFDNKAEMFTVSANSGVPAGTSATFTVSPGAADQIVRITADPINNLPLGVEQPLVSEVRDEWDNPVGAGVSVTHRIVSAPDASAYLRDAVGDTTDGITTTAANGRASVRLGVANTVGLNQVSAAIGDGSQSVTYDVNTVAGGIAYYTVDMGGVTTMVAGTSVPFTVRAFDSNDNPVDDDVTQVALTADPGVGLVFGTNPITLTNGVASTTVTANPVQLDYRVRASTAGNPAITGLGAPVDVTPAAPAGTITATASADTITANGTSITTLTSGVIRDAFGNQVPAGGGVNVSATNGGVVLGGLPKIIDTNGRIQFDLRSSSVPGTSTVTMSTVAGSATGNRAIVFAQPVTFAATAAPTPAIVRPGDNVAFSVPVTNTSTTRANLTTATTLSFSDGTHTFAASLAGLQSIAPSSTATLVFNSAVLDPAFAAGQYTPVVTLVGSDAYGTAFSAPTAAPLNSIQVTSIEVATITAPPQVSRGQTRNVVVGVRNAGATTATLTGLTLSFTGGHGVYSFGAPSPSLPRAVPASGTVNITIPVMILPASTLGIDQIDAFAQATVGGQPVTDNSLAPNPLPSWEILAQANLAYQSGTLSPTSAARGKSYAFQMTVVNNGTAVVSLDPATTRLTFTDGTNNVAAAPVQAYAVAGGATQSLSFVSTPIPAGFALGLRDVVLNAQGTDNGAPFSQLVSTGSDKLNIVTPAALSIQAGTLLPTVTSQNATATFTIGVNNTGGSSVVLTPGSTTLSFPGFTATLNPAGNTTILPGAVTILTFQPTLVSTGVAPGNHAPSVQISGTENGLPLSAGPLASPTSVLIQAAPDIAISAILTSQPNFTADQARRIQARVVVTNNGGATVSFTSASLRLFNGAIERTSQFAITSPVAFASGGNLGPGATDSLVFQMNDAPGAMSAGNLSIEGLLNVEDIATSDAISANTSNGGKGTLLVQTPAVLSVPVVIPSQPVVTAGMTKHVKIRAVIRNTGQSSAQINPSLATLAFAPAAGWGSTPSATLTSGDNTLAGGETDTVLFDVGPAGTIPGNATVGATVIGTETNSGRPLNNTSPTPASVTVQSPGSIDVTGVVSSRATITNNGTAAWTLTVTGHNPGQAAVDLDLGSAVGVIFGSASTPPPHTVPLSLVGGGVTLSGGETDQFVISIDEAGSYTALGAQNVQVLVTGTEPNSGAGRSDTGLVSVTVQAPPSVAYLSVSPSPVAKGVSVPFNVTVRNTVANGATITLDRAATRLRFAAGSFDAGLLPTSPNVIAAGQTVTLNFAGTLIPSGVTLGDQNDAELVIAGTDNGNSRPPVIVAVTDGDIAVVDAPELSIVSLVASGQNVTVGQTSPVWTIAMTVRNLGGLPVILHLDAASTFLQLNRLSNGANVTSEYTLVQPVALVNAGDDTLTAGATDNLVFSVQQAGATPGTVVISGVVMGTDTDGNPVLGNTDAGGSGTFTLQTPAALSILSVTPARTTATVGQTFTYPIRMVVRNTGQADADLNLTKPNTNLTFSGSGWTTTLSPNLAGGGVTLSGGETDTVTFTANVTGSPAGLATIGGNLSGTELNTGALRVDDTASGGSGSITLQNAAAIAITQVTVSRPSVTANSAAPWSVDATVANTGGAPARITLPGGVSATVQDGTVPFGPVAGFVEGGDVIPAGETRTLRFSTAGTGAFSSFGVKTVTVAVSGVDANSNAPVNDSDNSRTVLVQNAPDLQLVSVDPDTLTSGANTGLNVLISNADPAAATAVLDRASTRVYFAGAYSAFLDLASGTSIPGGGSTLVRFEPKVVSESIVTGPYALNLDVAYLANGVDTPASLRVLANGVTVQAAPQLFILGIDPSQPRVTSGQTIEWTVTMRLRNNGTQPIVLDLTPPETGIEFLVPGGNPDNGYTVVAPLGLGGGGGVSLAAGAENDLVFRVTQTGSLTGLVAINGRVAGLVGGITEVSDDTFDGGAGVVDVQSASSVAVTAIHTTQPRVTAGQATDWGVRVVLTNTGSADVDVDLAGSGIALDGSTAGWSIGAATLLGGGNTIEGGAVDSLLFNIDVTGPAGTPRIDALVPYVEVNTQLADTLRTDVSGFGSVVVQTPPQLSIASTTLDAPNAPSVNTSQGYAVAVWLVNNGEAAASNVQLGVSTNGSSTIAVPSPVAVPGGGSPVLVSIGATSGGTPGVETLTARVLSALDANAGTAITPLVATDSTAAVSVQLPAQLAVTYVRPSQPSVTQGQSNAWNVIVAVNNSGQAALDLTAPTEDDLGFSVAGTTEIDYVVQPPTQFASGNPVWGLAGGAVDSLVYTIVATGTNTGTVDIDAGVSGTDRNDASAVSDSGATQVSVQPAAGLSILSTLTVGTVNHPTAGRDTVNTNFAYQIHVTVQNRGEKVDSVLVNLATDDGSAIQAASLIRRSIDPDSLHTFVFDVTSPGVPTPLETFTSSILPGAISHNSGQPVTPQPPVDNTQVVVTRTPANLVVSLTTTLPTVSPGQQFQLTGRVTNSGQALLTGPAQVTLTPPATGGTFAVVESLVRNFVAGAPIVWNVTAPGAQQPAQTFTCTITAIPNDVNSGQTAQVSTGTAQQAVTVSTGGALSGVNVAITAPAGAQDDTVSVSQNFTVHAQVNATGDTDDVTATLSLPAGYSVVGASVRPLGNGPGVKQTDYTVIAPSSPGAAADVVVTFTGTDRNSGSPVPSAADTVAVTVVPRTSLSVGASVTAPPEAVDNTVGVNSPFTVTATVTNVAGAAGIGAPGTLTIALPAGYMLAANPPQSLSQLFDIGTPVEWRLVSPSGPQGPDQIAVTITTTPPDENSGGAAQVTTNSASIAMVTEGAVISVSDVTDAMDITHGPVPGGTAGTRLLAFAMRYVSTDGNAPGANIDTLAVTVVDGDGRPLGNGALAQTLKRMTIDLGGAQPYEVVDPSVNPVLFNLSAGGADRVIAPNGTVTAIVTVDLDGSPRVTEFSVGVRDNGIVIRDSGSNTVFGVTDGNGRPLDGHITSDPLIVLSSDFAEYVHNYPNPFRAGSQSTKIAYFMEQPGNVSIKVYSLTGELVWEENIPSGDAGTQTGPQEVTWDGRNGNGEVVRNGVYVCVLNAGSNSTRFNIAVAK